MNGRSKSRFRAIGALAALTMVSLAACERPSAKQSVDTILKESGKSRSDVFPLAGRITIDSQPPQAGGLRQPRVTLVLFPESKLDAPLDGLPKATCEPNGEFSFSTYDRGDGVAPGKYVLAIVELKFDKRKGYSGKDLLKNLYNDPDQNLKNPELVIDHHAPGKKDYAIDLKLAGREAASPGPHSVLTMH